MGTVGAGITHFLPLPEAADPACAWHIKGAQVMATDLYQDEINRIELNESNQSDPSNWKFKIKPYKAVLNSHF